MRFETHLSGWWGIWLLLRVDCSDEWDGCICYRAQYGYAPLCFVLFFFYVFFFCFVQINVSCSFSVILFLKTVCCVHSSAMLTKSKHVLFSDHFGIVKCITILLGEMAFPFSSRLPCSRHTTKQNFHLFNFIGAYTDAREYAGNRARARTHGRSNTSQQFSFAWKICFRIKKVFVCLTLCVCLCFFM